jgi:exopolyphosphatase/pppGpp-phosphohydrolase
MGRSKFLLPIVLMMSSVTLTAGTVARAAIDWGSGAVKINTSIVDTDNQQLVGEPLFVDYRALCLTEDVESHQGKISPEMIQKGLDLLADYKKQALAAAAAAGYEEVEFSGIATASFRKALNGREPLERSENELGIPFRIISQDEEAHLGLMTARALYPYAGDELVAWDNGNGSFQISAEDENGFHVYRGPLGVGTVRMMLERDMRGKPVVEGEESPNPVSLVEAFALAGRIIRELPPVPEWFTEKAATGQMSVVSWGGSANALMMVARAVYLDSAITEATITREDVHAMIATWVHKTDAYFDNADVHRKTVLAAVLVASIMHHFGIETVQFKFSLGSTSGMLIAPEYWPATAQVQ